MKLWERPAVRLLVVFFFLGLFAWWTFQAVSLPMGVRSLWETDEAVAFAARLSTEEEQAQRDLDRLPAPPENHAPEVNALLERLRNLPPVPYVVQAARRRDAARREGEPPLPWKEEEKKAEDELIELYLKAWEPFFSASPPDWGRFPDSIRLFRFNLAAILDLPAGYNAAEILLHDQFRAWLITFRHLGALRLGTGLGTNQPWGNTDLVGLFRGFCEMIQQGFLPEESLRLPLPPTPEIADLRLGLQSDQALFLRMAEYLEAVPENISASTALRRCLNNSGDADLFLQATGSQASARELAGQLRGDAERIAAMEQNTFLSGLAWRQWLEGQPGGGLSPTLQAGLAGLQEFEPVRLLYQVMIAMLEARQRVAASGLETARQLPDPAQPGQFLRVNQGEEGLTISSEFRMPNASSKGVTVTFPADFRPANRP